MTRHEFSEYWQMHYGHEPRAHEFREIHADRWFRIYGLPEGKRYPTNADEYLTVLHRHNALLSVLLGPIGEAILITTAGSLSEYPVPVQDSELAYHDAWYWKSLPVEQNDLECGFWHLYGRRIVWQTAVLDRELRLVADWNTTNLFVVGVEQGVVYAPYDGGADVIARDRWHKELLKAQFCDWLSPLPSGL